MDAVGVAAAVALISILVFIHELGHFLFARAFGVGVEVFSLGFGPTVASFRWGATEYRLSALPLGGYVRMEGADPFMGEDTELERSSTSLYAKPAWQRMVILAAGPGFNLILPVIVFTALYMAGEEQSRSVVGTVEQGSVAWEAGLRPGDEVIAADGRPVGFWLELADVFDAAGGPVELEVRRGAEELTLAVAAPEAKNSVFVTEDYGVHWTRAASVVGVPFEGSPAARAGLRSFDRVTAVDGVAITSYDALLEELGRREGPRVLSVQRAQEDAEPLELELRLEPDPGWAPPPGPVEALHANRWGVVPGVLVIGRVVEDSAAEAADLRRGDVLVAVDEVPLLTWEELTHRIQARQKEGPQPVTLTLLRQGGWETVSLTPRMQRDTNRAGVYYYRAVIGVGPGGGWAAGPSGVRQLAFLSALGQGVDETQATARKVLEIIGKLVTGEAAPSQTLGGPIQIFRDAGAAAEQGLMVWARMMGLLSVSLGIINFLPVPVLDGGQFLMDLVELLRGRPVSLLFRERAQQLGVLFLVALSLAVMTWDINRWLTQG